MKQLVTIFRAEGKQAGDLRSRCRAMRPKDFISLREDLQKQALSTESFGAYVEFLDACSMGDDFERAMGPGGRVRYVPAGVLYFRGITPLMQLHLQRQVKKKQQFPEQRFLITVVSSLAASPIAPKAPVAIAMFREILGSSR